MRGLLRQDMQELSRPDTLRLLLECFLATEALKEAVYVINRLLQACPEQGEWPERQAEVWLKMGLPLEARTSYQKAAEAFQAAGLEDEARRCRERTLEL